MTGHSTHIAWLPHIGKWHVYCDQGCDLGSSAQTDKISAAVARADLHQAATTPTNPTRKVQ